MFPWAGPSMPGRQPGPRDVDGMYVVVERRVVVVRRRRCPACCGCRPPPCRPAPASRHHRCPNRPCSWRSATSTRAAGIGASPAFRLPSLSSVLSTQRIERAERHGSGRSRRRRARTDPVGAGRVAVVHGVLSRRSHTGGAVTSHVGLVLRQVVVDVPARRVVVRIGVRIVGERVGERRPRVRQREVASAPSGCGNVPFTFTWMRPFVSPA